MLSKLIPGEQINHTKVRIQIGKNIGIQKYAGKVRKCNVIYEEKLTGITSNDGDAHWAGDSSLVDRPQC